MVRRTMARSFKPPAPADKNSSVSNAERTRPAPAIPRSNSARDASAITMSPNARSTDSSSLRSTVAAIERRAARIVGRCRAHAHMT